MGALVQLDSDRARLSWGEEQADRDIVQFVGEKDDGMNGIMKEKFNVFQS
jgi:hypothetical protein